MFYHILEYLLLSLTLKMVQIDASFSMRELKEHIDDSNIKSDEFQFNSEVCIPKNIRFMSYVDTAEFI